MQTLRIKVTYGVTGKMVLNGADYAPFELYGVGVFMAFSGNGVYRNKGACGAIKGDGPFSPGKCCQWLEHLPVEL